MNHVPSHTSLPPKFPWITNLTAQEINLCNPWETTHSRPHHADKGAYRKWCEHPMTDHCFVSAVVGKLPALRISDVNPPDRMVGLILDYDAVPPGQPEEVVLQNAPTNYRPAYVGRTFSGHVRVVYLFEQPVPIFNNEIAREFVKKCQK